MVDYALDTTPPENLYNLSIPSATPQLPPTAVAVRAAKATYGMNNLLPYEDIEKGINEGEEPSVRERAAALVNLDNRRNTDWLLNTGALSPIAIANKFASQDPQSVFEERYAKQYMDQFYSDPTRQSDGTFSEAVKNYPNETAEVLGVSRDTLAWRELVHKRKVDAQTAYDTQSGMSKDYNLLKSMTGFTNLYTLRGNVSGTFLSGGLLGSNLEAQRYELAKMPYAQRKDMFNKIMDYLTDADPEAAHTFADYMESPSAMKEVQDNAFNLLDLAVPLSAVGGVSKLARRKLIQAEVRRMSTEATEHAPLADIENVHAVAHAATGDLTSAAVDRVTAEQATVFRGTEDPTGLMKDGIQSAFKTTSDPILAGGPGNLGAEIMNRIRASFDIAAGKVINAATNTARILRISDILANQAVARETANEIKNRYPGLAGNVININPVKHEIISNTFSADVILGRNDGSFFGSVDEAMAFARFNNIPVKSVHGVPLDPNAPSRGAAIHITETGPAPGQTKTLGELLSTGETFGGAKTQRDLERLAPKIAGQELETTKVGKYTAYRPANGGVFSQGNGFYIAVNRPLNETANFIREAVAETEKSLTVNKGWMNRLGMGWIRTPSDVLSKQEMTNRQLAIYAPAIFRQIVSDAYAPVNLARKQFRGKTPWQIWDNLGKGKEFEEAVKDMSRAGTDFADVPAIENYWMTKFKHLPDEVQVAGYFALKQGEAMDYIFRNLAINKHMARVGGEQHILTKMVDGLPVKSKSFVGVNYKEVPDSDENVIIQDGDKFSVKRVSNLKQEYRDGVKDGSYRLVRVYNPELKELQDFANTDKYVGYVLSKNVETRPLDFVQLPRRQGGHQEYLYDHYLKQANMDIDSPEGKGLTYYRYKGDTTAMALESRALGKDVAKYMNAVRMGIKTGDIDGAKLAARNLPIDWDTLSGYFTAKSGGLPARFDINEPFYVVPKGKSIADLENHFGSYDVKDVSEFRDTTRRGSLARQFQTEFTGERDAYDVFAMHSEGTQWNPVFLHRPADTVDPFTSINRAVSRITASTYMDDVKISSIDGWLQRAKSVLDVSADEWKDNPARIFNTAKLKRGIDPTLHSQLEAERYQIKAFAGIPSQIDTWLDSISQKFQDSIYGAQNPFTRATATIGKWSFDTTVAAPAFIRAVAYRADIGLFSLPQLLVQSNTYITIAGLSGYKKAGQGAAAAMLHQYSRLPISNTAVLEHLDSIAQKLGWRPGEWLEARQALGRTGFEFVGSESNITMQYGHMHPNNIAKTAWGSFLDAGDMFFKGGERNARYGAWYTAFKEFRDVKPNGRLTVSDINDILNRADDLSGNMTKASRSLLQSGLGSFTTQFLGYQMRLMEMFLGKRITPTQRARLLFTYAGVYGAPVATGVVSVLPISDRLRQYALEHGYVEGESQIADGFMNGVPASLLKLATGNWYNVGERYGSPGFDLPRDILYGNKSFWSMFAGASGSVVTDSWERADPFVRQMASWLRGDNAFKLTAEDVLGPLRIPTSGNNLMRLHTALTSGDWITKHENIVSSGVQPWNAVLMSATGLQPLEADKGQLYKAAGENQKIAEQNAENEFLPDFRRGLRDLRNKDPNSADQHFRNAFGALERYHYPQFKRDSILAQALDNQTMPEKEAWNYWVSDRHTPSGDETWRKQVYGRIQAQGNLK